MLTIRVVGKTRQDVIEHSDGALELGRGPPREARRHLVNDPSVSRDQLRIEERTDGKIHLENLSQTKPVLIDQEARLEIGESRAFAAPVRMTIGDTRVTILQRNDEPLDEEG